jgi:hypothetical protein
VGVAVKHQQLARQVGAFIEHPPENSMASFNFTSAVLDEGTAFTGPCFCIADDGGGFNSHLAETREPTTSSLASCRDIDDFDVDLDGI